MKNKSGFTLIELLIVIAIVGILSSIVIASLTSARKKGKAAAVKSGMTQLLTQGQLYLSEHNNFAVASSSPRAGCFASSTNTFLNDSIFGDPHPADMVREINNQGAPVYCVISASGMSFSLIAALDNGKNLCLDSDSNRLEAVNITNQTGICATAPTTFQGYINSSGTVTPSPFIVPIGSTIVFNYTAGSGEYRLVCSPQNIPVFTLDREHSSRSITFNTPGTMNCTEDEDHKPHFNITVQ